MSHVTTAAAQPVAASTASASPPSASPAPQLPRTVQPPLAGGGRILPIIPQTLEQVMQVAALIARSGTAPDCYRADGGEGPIDTDTVAVAILAGLEVGLAPMAAVTGIAMLDGVPTIWGDARDGLVAASGLLEDMKEEMVVDADGLFLSATCTVWRKGRPTPTVQTVTRPQAALAGWLENDNWMTNPNRMAQVRAKGWANHDAFPDVLKGLRSQDEVADMLDVTGRGSASTAPPGPRRADFAAPTDQQKPAAAANPPPPHRDEPLGQNDPDSGQDDPGKAEGWPLHDETGETVDRYEPARWADEFESLTGKLEGPALIAAIDNNREAGIRIATDHRDEIGSIIAEGLIAVFGMVEAPATAAAEAPEAENLIPAGTQTECADQLVALIEASTTVARLNRIVRVNIERVKTWTQTNRDRVFDAQDARLEHLRSGGFP